MGSASSKNTNDLCLCVSGNRCCDEIRYCDEISKDNSYPKRLRNVRVPEGFQLNKTESKLRSQPMPSKELSMSSPSPQAELISQQSSDHRSVSPEKNRKARTCFTVQPNPDIGRSKRSSSVSLEDQKHRSNSNSFSPQPERILEKSQQNNSSASVNENQTKREGGLSQNMKNHMLKIMMAPSQMKHILPENRLVQCRESGQSSWIEIPKPLKSWSDEEQNMMLQILKEHPRHNKDPVELEKVIVHAIKKMPLKSREDCILCVEHLESRRVGYYYTK